MEAAADDVLPEVNSVEEDTQQTLENDPPGEALGLPPTETMGAINCPSKCSIPSEDGSESDAPPAITDDANNQSVPAAKSDCSVCEAVLASKAVEGGEDGENSEGSRTAKSPTSPVGLSFSGRHVKDTDDAGLPR